MEESTKPEILKMHLGLAVLQLLSLGVSDVEKFDFVESPPRSSLMKSFESLQLLRAVEQDGTLNYLGREMLQLPTEPQLSKALLEGLSRGCGRDVIIVASLMSCGHDVFYRGTVEKRNECDIQKQQFCQTSGDLLSAVDVYKKWIDKPSSKQSNWCKANAINSKLLRSVRESYKEIENALKTIKPDANLDVTSSDVKESLVKSLLAGFFENIAWSHGHEKLGYTSVLSRENAKLHPSSVLSCLGDQPDWVMYQQLKRTGDQVYLENVTPFEFDWIAEVAIYMLQFIDEDEISKCRVERKQILCSPELVKAVIGSKGSTIKHIESSISTRAASFSPSNLCAIECNVDKGTVDVYASKNCLDEACKLVNDVIKSKQNDLQGYSEISICNGGLKSLMCNDLQTKLILQKGMSCKFNVFLEIYDLTEEVC